jgi:hypothetical protein
MRLRDLDLLFGGAGLVVGLAVGAVVVVVLLHGAACFKRSMASEMVVWMGLSSCNRQSRFWGCVRSCCRCRLLAFFFVGLGEPLLKRDCFVLTLVTLS